MIKRRAFIAGLGGAAAWPMVARGQQAGKVYRVAVISPATPVSELTESGFRAFRAFLIELRRLSYVEGQNLIVDRYSGEGRPERYADLARDVVARQPDVVFTVGSEIPRHLQRASATIPIVALVVDPIASGLSTSLARLDRRISPRRKKGVESTCVNTEAGVMLGAGTSQETPDISDLILRGYDHEH
jgi:putative ABC transport system substrate-binding protein